MMRRLLILVGLVLSTAIYAVLTNGLGWGKPIDFKLIEQAAWLGLPKFEAPVFETRAIALIVPVALILVAEISGHLKAVGAMTGRDMAPSSAAPSWATASPPWCRAASAAAASPPTPRISA